MNDNQSLFKKIKNLKEQTGNSVSEKENTDSEHNWYLNDQNIIDFYMNNMKVFELDNNKNKIRIIQAVHIAPKHFYDNVYNIMGFLYKQGNKIHFEGVGSNKKEADSSPDKNNRLHETYSILAGIMELEAQKIPENRQFEFENHDAKLENEPFHVKKLLAAFIKTTYLFATALVQANQEKSIKGNLRKMIVDVIKKSDKQNIKNNIFFKLTGIGNFITDKRETIAINAALKANQENHDVVMWWGAAHATSFIETLQTHGYKLVSEKSVNEFIETMN